MFVRNTALRDGAKHAGGSVFRLTRVLCGLCVVTTGLFGWCVSLFFVGWVLFACSILFTSQSTVYAVLFSFFGKIICHDRWRVVFDIVVGVRSTDVRRFYVVFKDSCCWSGECVDSGA